MATVSVVIPAYNTATYLAESLDSVFTQTYRDFEVIIINDGSPDTDELEKALQSYSLRITYLRQENRGPSAARNLGIRHSRGEFLAFLDSDDLWEREYLGEQLKFLRSDPSLDMVYCNTFLFGDDGVRYALHHPPEPNVANFETLVTGNCTFIFPSGTVVRRSKVAEAGLFDESVPLNEDLDLWLRIAHRGGRIAFNSKRLARRRAHTASLAQAYERLEEWRIKVFVKAANTLALSPSARTQLERRIAQLRAEGNLRMGKQYLGEGKFEQAKTSFARANAFFRRTKLRLLLAGLRISPGLTQRAAKAWKAADTSLESVRRSTDHPS